MLNSQKYWVACSGGIDSVFLVQLMNQLKYDFGILHCNFNLRGEDSKQDEVFVRKLAEEINCPIRVKDFDTLKYKEENRINTQLAARELRYHWFDEVIQKENGIVVLAHHFDDQVETFFLQLRRGGSVKGLSGMPVFKNGYFRPLLAHKKEELIAVAQKNNWKWREDKSNAENDYTRNWYRNEVLPFFKENGVPVEEAISLVQNFQKVLQFFNSLPLPHSILFERWTSYPIWYRQHILNEHNLGEFPEQEITRLTKAEKGKLIENNFAEVRNEGEYLLFSSKNLKKVEYKLFTKIILKENIEINPVDLFLDASKVTGKLSFRKWNPGDQFQPLGMKGQKKIGKFLRDRKIESHKKEDIYVLTNEKEQILGVFGFGIDEKFKIKPNTKEVLWVKLVEV